MSLTLAERPQNVDVVLFGADDPEARCGKKLCDSLGIRVVQATFQGADVDFHSACHPDGLSSPIDSRLDVATFETIVPPQFGLVPVANFNHHGERDFGYRIPAERYREGSSLGQLASTFDIVLDEEQATTAALDHCMAAAIGDKLEDVDQKCALKQYLQDIVETHKTSMPTLTIADVYDAYKEARNSLGRFPRVPINGQDVIDMRREHLGSSISIKRLVIMAALAAAGEAGITLSKDGHANKSKLMLNGFVDPSTVEEFIKRWAPANGVPKPFGVPLRMFAGGELACDAAIPS